MQVKRTGTVLKLSQRLNPAILEHRLYIWSTGGVIYNEVLRAPGHHYSFDAKVLDLSGIDLNDLPLAVVITPFSTYREHASIIIEDVINFRSLYKGAGNPNIVRWSGSDLEFNPEFIGYRIGLRAKNKDSVKYTAIVQKHISEQILDLDKVFFLNTDIPYNLAVKAIDYSLGANVIYSENEVILID